MEHVETRDGEVFGVDQIVDEQFQIAGVNGNNIHPEINNVLEVQEAEQIDYNNNEINHDR